MNNNMTKGHLKLLQEQYAKACNAYLNALLNIWELDAYYGFWVCEEVGGVYSYGDNLFINMDEMRYVVENNVSRETFDEWTEYCLWAKDFEQSTPSLKSWCEGCPRVDEATQEKLTAMRNELNELIKETKAKF